MEKESNISSGRAIILLTLYAQKYNVYAFWLLPKQ